MARPRKVIDELDLDEDVEVEKANPNDPEFWNEFHTDWQNSWNPHTKQKEIITDFISGNYDYLFVRAGRKFSKTTVNIKAAWYKSLQKFNSTTYSTFPTIALGTEIVWDEKRLQFCDMLTPYMMQKYVKYVDNNKHIIHFVNDSHIKLQGTWTEARGRGTQPNFLTVDEIQDCNNDWIEAMDSNLGPKQAPCIMSGTPPKKRNHYHDWEQRILNNPRGKIYHYSSYDNDAIPHLKGWLDNKKLELIKAGKEDVWLREYMAEDCFSHADRVLPDAKFEDYVLLDQEINKMSFRDKTPVMAIATQGKYICAVWGILSPKKYLYITDFELRNAIWDKSYVQFIEEPIVKTKSKLLQDACGNRMRYLLWDSTKSFKDVIRGFTECKERPEWQDRGIPLLREMMIERRIILSDKVAPFGMECQNLLADENKKEIEKNYPMICAMSVMANEWFQRDKVDVGQIQPYDKHQALRDAGILISPRRPKGKVLFVQKDLK
jgi:hypothetical protein